MRAAQSAGDSLQHLRRGLDSGFDYPLRALVRDSEGFKELWAWAARGETPAQPRPPVAFSREMVIVAAMGSHPTSDAGIRIDSVITRGPSLVVHVSVYSDTRNLCTTGRRVVTHPVDVVKASTFSGDVVFRERYFAAGCKMY